jgi:hypothetical protein
VEVSTPTARLRVPACRAALSLACLVWLGPGIGADAGGPAAGIAVGIHIADADPAERAPGRLLLVDASLLPPCDGAVLAASVPAAPSRPAFVLPRPPADALECWLDGLAALAGAAARRNAAYLVPDVGEVPTPPDRLSYILKRAAVTLRAADPTAVVVAGPLPDAGEPWLEQLVSTSLRPYVHALAGLPEATAVLAATRDLLLPGLPVWSVEREVPAADGPALVRVATALSAGAEVVVVRAAGARERADVLAFADAIPAGGYPSARRSVRSSAGAAPLIEIVGGEKGAERLAVLAPHEHTRQLRIGFPPVGRVTLVDTAGRREARTRRRSGGDAGVRLPATERFTLVSILPAPDFEPERLAVDTERRLTAEEIIAREREVRARQELALDAFIAAARISYHFTITNAGESVDVVTENEAFGVDGAIEYRQTSLYINGHRWKGKPPSFPFIAPEKVKDIPLEIAIHEGYVYELQREERQRGRECYRIGFEPAPDSGAGFRGVVWIDRASFQRVRMDLVRLEPSEPVTSDVLTQWFDPVDSPAGSFWMMTEVRGEMHFSALGRNAVLEREVLFQDFRPNAEEFGERRAAARASDDPMYRDSLDEGLVALVPDGESGRSARSATTKANTLLVGGINGSFDDGLDLPFAAINFFDMNLGGTGTQIDVLWAGPVAALSLTRKLGESAWEASLEVRASAIESRDRFTDHSGERDELKLERLDERVRAYFRRPLGPFFTVSLEPGLSYLSVSRTSATRDDYLLPPDAITGLFGARIDHERRGYQVSTWAEIGHREDWGPYGLPGERSRTDVRDTHLRYGVRFDKNIHTRRMDRVGLNLNLWGGDDLDRFSMFSFKSFDGVRLRGFDGKGIHFTRGVTGQVKYAFRTPGNLRLELSLGGGVFENREDYGEGSEYAYGGGFAITFPGAWGTLFRLRTSYGIDSSLPIEGSRDSVRLTVLRTFDGWWPWGKRYRDR